MEEFNTSVAMKIAVSVNSGLLPKEPIITMKFNALKGKDLVCKASVLNIDTLLDVIKDAKTNDEVGKEFSIKKEMLN